MFYTNKTFRHPSAKLQNRNGDFENFLVENPHFFESCDGNLIFSEKIFLNNAGCLSDTINKVGSLPDEYFTILNERNYVLV